jgi:hypothetical protein
MRDNHARIRMIWSERGKKYYATEKSEFKLVCNEQIEEIIKGWND